MGHTDHYNAKKNYVASSLFKGFGGKNLFFPFSVSLPRRVNTSRPSNNARSDIYQDHPTGSKPLTLPAYSPTPYHKKMRSKEPFISGYQFYQNIKLPAFPINHRGRLCPRQSPASWKTLFLPGLINTTLFLMFSFHLQVRGLRTKTVSSRRTENKPSRTNRTLPLVAREACVSPPCIECVSCW